MSQSFIKKPNNGPHSALAGLGVLTAEQQRILDAIPKKKRCEACRAVGAVHCSDPSNCGGPWDEHRTENDHG